MVGNIETVNQVVGGGGVVVGDVADVGDAPQLVGEGGEQDESGS